MATRVLFLLLSLCLVSPVAAQKFDGLALTPPMGWNSWNTFREKIDEKLIRQVADTMASNGMREAGYEYIVMDDCWSTMQRDADGKLVPDPEKFPSGMKALGDYLHAKGFKFGIYNCAGDKTCQGYPGGNGYEEIDAKTYASWGVDYLKYDFCNAKGADPRERYAKMRDALYAAGRPVVFSMCEWGDAKPWTWAGDVAHLWRTTHDIGPSWNDTKDWDLGVKVILDKQVGLAPYAGPGHWNDPDMLEVGKKGLTFVESRSHFSLWCVLAAPLMAGNDIRNMSEPIREVLTNRRAIAVNQDPLGKQATRVHADDRYEVWLKPLVNNEWAVCVLNVRNEPIVLEFAWDQIVGLPSGVMSVHDIWRDFDAGTTGDPYRVELDSRDVALLHITPKD